MKFFSKRVLLFLAIAIPLIFSFFLRTEKVEKKRGMPSHQLTGLEILRNDRAQLEKKLSAEVLKDPSWDKVNDFTVSIDDLVSANNSLYLFKLSSSTVIQLKNCLKKDFCGMQTRNENDAYFDETKTPGHILLKRNLEILSRCLLLRPELVSEIDGDLMLELTQNENEDVQVLAIEILKKNQNENSNSLMTIIENYSGNAKANALVEFSKNKMIDDRLVLIDGLEKTFAFNDINTVLSVIEKLDEMNLSKEDLIRTSKNLCHFKSNSKNIHNWKMINYDLGKLSIDLENICSN